MNFPVEDWELIPTEVFKALLAEVKERFDTMPEEIVSVTEKSPLHKADIEAIKKVLTVAFVSFFQNRKLLNHL